MGIHIWAVGEAKGTPAKGSPTDSMMVGYTVALLTWVLSSGVYIAAKYAIAEMPPWTLCFWRVAIAAGILLPVIRHHGTEVYDLVRHRGLELLVIGGLGLGLCQGLMYVALEHTTAINAGLILALTPIFTMILARFVLGEAMGPWQIIGSLVAMLGMVVIVVKGSFAALIEFSIGRGELLVVVAAAFLAVYTVFLRRAKFPLPRLQLLVVLLCAAVVAVFPLYLYELARGEVTHMDIKGYLALAYAAIPGGALMYFLYNWSIDALGASKAGAFMYTQMVFIAILAYLILGEQIELYHIVGAGLIILGVVLVMALKQKAAMAPKA